MSSKRLKRKIWIAAYLRALSIAEPQRAAEIAEESVDIYLEKFPDNKEAENFDPYDPRCWSAEERASFEEAMRED
ncbi:hypothetical protein [Stenotrophomonas sp. S39]|uniref:hypothetical protein n=1 Tax=Stenotrophomonas sp. S39 TaxID=2767451 RepID=UPI0019094016|nr:hypothetical protein [Stenotrophomonas sp. S39]MBK0054502.1 hypothetical protein [Stenotrophomonas sp. S39]